MHVEPVIEVILIDEVVPAVVVVLIVFLMNTQQIGHGTIEVLSLILGMTVQPKARRVRTVVKLDTMSVCPCLHV